MSDLLLITPPFTQLNTPYPATVYLKGFLNTKDISSFQIDLGIEVILDLFSRKGLQQLFDHILTKASFPSAPTPIGVQRILSLKEDYIQTIDSVMAFLQGKNQTLAKQICTQKLLPQGERFEQLDELDWAFGNMGFQDKAKHLATLFLEDISDFIVATTDEHFGFSRYAERLGQSANSFDELHEELHKKPSYVDRISFKILIQHLKKTQPKLVCFSVPFPGNLYSAFRCAQFIKSNFPEIKIAMGGGFANTELRSVSDPRVFDFFDFITLDDGELPIELLVSNVLNPSPKNPNYNFFKRTFLKENGAVVYNNFSLRKDYNQVDVGTPDYSDLLLDQYISVIELANPMHTLWSDGRWNKLTMAHGCYWGKCTFCDISLDYIKLYEPVTAKMLVDRMTEMIEQTGEQGFHFVDEAAPPSLMKAVAIEILNRNLLVTWWTNIRFEKNFTPDLCRLLSASGCIAVSGGLEVASDRLLALIQKGVTVEQVAQVTRNFTDAGIMVHAYLMYGYPTQTVQETVDSLEMVRQMFEHGVLQSGFWHQFALTAHSPVGLNPNDYGIKPKYNAISFANNDIEFEDSTGIDHNQFSFGLKKSLYNYMHGICFDFPLGEWFDFKIPDTKIEADFIENALERLPFQVTKKTAKLLWIGKLPLIQTDDEDSDFVNLIFHNKTGQLEISLEPEMGEWLIKILKLSSVGADGFTFGKLKNEFDKLFEDFELFWWSEEIVAVREIGWLVL